MALPSDIACSSFAKVKVHVKPSTRHSCVGRPTVLRVPTVRMGYGCDQPAAAALAPEEVGASVPAVLGIKQAHFVSQTLYTFSLCLFTVSSVRQAARDDVIAQRKNSTPWWRTVKTKPLPVGFDPETHRC